MTASGKTFKKETSQEIVELISPDSFPLPPPVVDIVTGYAIGNSWVAKPVMNQSLFFAGVDITLQQILYLAENAGPLDVFEALVRRLIRKEVANPIENSLFIQKTFTLGNRKAPLLGCLMIGLDHDLGEHNKGMVESLIKIVIEELGETKPEIVQILLEQAKQAAPIESEADKSRREKINKQVIESVFSAFKQQSCIESAISLFKWYIEVSRNLSTDDQGHLINNLFYINLLDLICNAFEILTKQRVPGGLSGEVVHQFCKIVIGEILQSKLPPRMIQLFKKGLFKLKEVEAEREIDMIGPHFQSYYNDYEYVCRLKGTEHERLNGYGANVSFKLLLNKITEAVGSTLTALEVAKAAGPDGPDLTRLFSK